MSELIQYETMRVAVRNCATIDEAKQVQDKAEALRLYARQRDDKELEVWMAEIRLRASIRVGELVRELESQQGARTDLNPAASTGGKLKAIEDAGLSERTAQRYQELAGGREEAAQQVGVAAAESYFARARAAKEPATMEGLRSSIRAALTDALGPPPPRAARSKAPSTATDNDMAFTDFIGSVRMIRDLTTDPVDIAAAAEPQLLSRFVRECNDAVEKIHQVSTAMENRRHAPQQAAD